MGGLAAVGTLMLVLGICTIHWWRCWDKTSIYLMLVAGVCLAAVGASPLVKVGNMVGNGADQAAGWFGAAGAGLLIVTIVLTIHVVRAIWPKKGGNVQIGKSHQWGAFFVPVFIVAAGGITVIISQLMAGMSTAGDQLGNFIGG